MRMPNPRKRAENENLFIGGMEKEEGFFDNPVVKQVGRTAASVITRGLLGALGLGGRSTRKKKSGWF